jgi:hypothetical protein
MKFDAIEMDCIATIVWHALVGPVLLVLLAGFTFGYMWRWIGEDA